MIITNFNHQKIIEGLLDYFDLNPENLPLEKLSEVELYKQLFNKTQVPNIDKLYDYMLNKSDFFTAPASTKFHGNYKGGLAVHSLIVLALFIKKNNDYNLGLEDSQMIVSALTHDLCKCNFYVESFRNVKIYEGEGGYKVPSSGRVLSDPKGNFCWRTEKSFAIEDKFPLGHGNKSLFILMNYIKVDPVVAMLITWHMGVFANQADNQYGYNNACDYLPAVCALHTADEEASMIFEEKRDGYYID